jgi:uncharacterized protein YicC (UPF0701 family)
MVSAIAPEISPLRVTHMKKIKTIRTQLYCLCLAGLCAIFLSSCDWERETDTQRENKPDSLAELDDRTHLPEAEIARERATFERNMHQEAAAFSKQLQDLKAAVAKLPAQKQEEGKQMIAQMEKKLAEFNEQLAGIEKAAGMRWWDYRNTILGSSYDIKQHFARAEELVGSV